MHFNRFMYICNVFLDLYYQSVNSLSWEFDLILFFYKLESVSSIYNIFRADIHRKISEYLDVSKHPAVHLLIVLSVAWHG